MLPTVEWWARRVYSRRVVWAETCAYAHAPTYSNQSPFLCSSAVVLQEPGTVGLWDSLKLDQNIKNTICQESTGTRISPVKLSVVLSETRCPAQTTSVNFDTVFYNLVGCKYWCCSASSEFKKTKNKKTFGCLTVNPPFCPPEGDCFIKRSGAFGVLSVVCKYQDLLCQIQTKQIFFCRINEALEMLKCLFASISLPS